MRAFRGPLDGGYGRSLVGLRICNELSLFRAMGRVSHQANSPNKLYVSNRGGLLHAFHEVVRLAKYHRFSNSNNQVTPPPPRPPKVKGEGAVRNGKILSG